MSQTASQETYLKGWKIAGLAPKAHQFECIV